MGYVGCRETVSQIYFQQFRRGVGPPGVARRLHFARSERRGEATLGLAVAAWMNRFHVDWREVICEWPQLQNSASM
jgi:hypothetical protein